MTCVVVPRRKPPRRSLSRPTGPIRASSPSWPTWSCITVARQHGPLSSSSTRPRLDTHTHTHTHARTHAHTHTRTHTHTHTHTHTVSHRLWPKCLEHLCLSFCVEEMGYLRALQVKSGPPYLYIYLVLCPHGQESEGRQEGGLRKRWG